MEKPKGMQSCDLPELDKEAWMINLSIIKHDSHSYSSIVQDFIVYFPFSLHCTCVM